MRFALHRDFTEIPTEDWNSLAASGISDTPFARWEYARLWWQTRGGGEWPEGRLALVTATRSDRLAGIAPLFVAEHEGRHAILLVGSIEITDYLDLLVTQADVLVFVQGLLDFLEGSSEVAGMPFDWYNIPEESPTLPALRAEAERRGWQYEQQVFRPTPYVSLPGDFETYLSGLDKKQRHEIRRKLRRAEEGESPAVFQLVQDKVALEPAVDEFLDLMAHDTDKARFLTGAMRAHMRALMLWAWEAGTLWLAFLRVKGVPAAAAFNFDYRMKLWGYNSAVNRDYLDLSPGWVLLAHQIRWACEQGRTELDFMRGDEGYKFRFGAVSRNVARARITPRP